MKNLGTALAIVAVGAVIGFGFGLLRPRQIPSKGLHELPEA